MTDQQFEEYTRECEHSEECHWKECAECREYLIRKGLKAEFHAIRNKVLHEAIEAKPKKREAGPPPGGYYTEGVNDGHDEYEQSLLNLLTKE